MKLVHENDDDDVGHVLPMTNTFRLQVEDFMQETQLEKNAQETLKNLAASIEKALKNSAIKHSFDYHELDFWKTHDIAFPLAAMSDIIRRTTSLQPLYTFAMPSKISHLSLVSNNSIIDVDIVIPDAVFGKRDFVNIVYATKRAHYICSCIAVIRKLLPAVKIQFTRGAFEDSLFPDIFVSEEFNSKTGVVLHFHASETGLAPPSRFAPAVGNLRPSTVHTKYSSQDDVPTPSFNQRILRNLLSFSLMEDVNNCIKNKHSLSSALCLTLSWMNCHDHSKHLSTFIHAYFLYLVEEQIIVDQQDTLAVLRKLFQAIVTFDPESTSGFKNEGHDSSADQQYKNVFPAVFLDKSGYWNTLYSVSLNSFKRLQSEMSRAILLLGDATTFDMLFLSKTSFNDSFDYFMRLSLKRNTIEALHQKFPVDTVTKEDAVMHLLFDLEKNLGNAMGERFEYYDAKIIEKAPRMWKSASNSIEFTDITIVLGFRVSVQWTNPLTVGPVANLPEAKEFRRFWLNKSQLRKFADSRVCECVVWAGEASSAVPLNILQFLLKEKYDVQPSAVSWRSQVPPKLFSDVDVQDKIRNSFSSLNSILRSLRDLPLTITNIYGVSPFIRGAEPGTENVFACNSGTLQENHRIPSTNKFAKYTPSLSVFLKLEYSTKWGNDVEAIRKLASAFYIQIAEKLKSDHNLVAVPTADQIFVLKDRMVFRLVIVHDKIRSLLSNQLRQLKDNGASRVESTPLGLKLADFTKRYVEELAVQSSLSTISIKHSKYGKTVQLLKIWLSSHMLSNAVPDLVLEMIVAYCFEQAHSNVPRTCWAAFRRVLNILAHHNWLTKPLIVDLNNDWKDDDLLKLQEGFIKLRPVLPAMVVITNEDTMGSKWTRDSPSPLLLKRIVALAKTTISVLDENLTSDAPIDLTASLTVTNMKIYDAVIHLHPRAVSRNYKQSNDSEIKGLPIVDFDPVDELVFALNSNYHGVALFFFNKYGGDCIGVKFRPQEEEVPSKISRAALHSFADRKSLRLNKEEIFEGIRMLGSGIVKSIISC